MVAVNAATVPSQDKPRRFAGLFRRLVSGLVLAAMAAFAIWDGYPWFDALIAVGAALMMLEWSSLTGGWRRPFWLVLGLVYVLVPAAAVLWLHHDPHWGRASVAWLFVVVAAYDIAAFFTGRAIGGPRLAPLISPGKTWAGLLGGMVAAGLVGLGFAIALDTEVVDAVGLSLALALAAQLGDLFESAIKRYFGVKDSGRLIPGHGGILDRVDGLVAAVVLLALIRVLGEGAAPWA